MTLTDKLRNLFQGLLNSIGEFLYNLGIRANMLTALGILGNIIAAFFISYGNLVLGGVLVALTGPLDALDGTLARMQDDLKPFGALFDSVADRISESMIMLGLLIYFLERNNKVGCILVLVALIGSLMVSYVRARAQSLGSDPKLGILTRVERYIVTSLFLLLSQPVSGLLILAVFTHVTVFQRIWFAWKELH
jgi:CDP-diacylglycerol--glycerol-3-phosphate 3-phosphatidyltransferase